MLETALWNAVNYSEITLDDLTTLLDFCRMLYTPKDEMKLTLLYPRYWKMDNLGKGKLKFTLTNKVRTKEIVKWEPPKQAMPQPSLQSRPSNPGLKLKLKHSGQQQQASPAAPSTSTPTPPVAKIPTPQPQPPPPPQRRLTLKFSNAANG